MPPRYNNKINIWHTVVTTGSLWRFLKLNGQSAFVDIIEYPIQQLQIILGILQIIIHN